VYAAINAVQKQLAVTGISKSRSNTQQGYKFRGIDDVYNALAPVLAKHKLVIIPRIDSREVVERQTAKGGVLFNVTVAARFMFVSAQDGSRVTVRTYGEAMDSADKATNKAMSAAYKYAAFQTFCIPTEGDNDADAHTPEPTVAAVREPKGFAEWWADMQAVADEGKAPLQAAWQKSDVALRKYLLDHHKAQWEAAKAKAEKVAPAEAVTA
jgi:hypothetical protein